MKRAMSMTITRKQFLGSMLGVLGGLVAVGGCSTGEPLEASGGGRGLGGKADGDDDMLPDGGIDDDAGSQDAGDGGASDAGGHDGSITNDAGPAITPDAPPAMTCGSTLIDIDSNHGHVLIVSAADVAAGIAKSYNIKGTSGHAHTVTITAAMFATLKATGTLMTSSTENSFHTHDITVTCA
jgi:hypothetical protein